MKNPHFTVISRITNKRLGIVVYVSRDNSISPPVFSVSLKDTDAGEFVGTALLYKSYDVADTMAVNIAQGNIPQGSSVAL